MLQDVPSMLAAWLGRFCSACMVSVCGAAESRCKLATQLTSTHCRHSLLQQTIISHARIANTHSCNRFSSGQALRPRLIQSRRDGGAHVRALRVHNNPLGLPQGTPQGTWIRLFFSHLSVYCIYLINGVSETDCNNIDVAGAHRRESLPM